jgi:hypothetical protein
MKNQTNVGICTGFLALFFIVLLTGCNYTLNWRDAAFADDDFKALLPCKPDRAVRSVALSPGEPELPMQMMGCKAGGAMFTIARLDAADARQATTLLQTWPRTTERVQALAQASATSASGMVTLRGMAAGQPSVSRYVLRGNRVYQAAILGTPANKTDGPSALATEAEDTFFSGLKWAAQ